MISRAVARLAGFARRWTERDPFTNVYGLSRTLLALASALTLARNPGYILFSPVSGGSDAPRCEAGLSSASIFCVAGPDHTDVARWISVLVLLVVASGWRPRFTAIPHAWMSFSIFSSCTIFDGGDQITLVLSVLLLPVALLDSRRTHWASNSPWQDPRPIVRLAAWSALFVIRLQVAGVYFVSGIAKFGQAEWANGTAMYYWLLTFGQAPRWFVSLLGNPILVVLFTWGAIAFEITLAVALVLPRKRWPPLLAAGLFFHLLIALFFDLASFATAMMAALILYLRPADEPFPLRLSALRRFRNLHAIRPRLAPHM